MFNEEKLAQLQKNKKSGSSLLSDKFKKLEEKAKELKNGNIMHVSIASLDTNPYQPRIEITKNEIQELANSIQENGLLSPILIVEKGNGRYYILAGHRRVEAHKILNKDTIQAILVKDKNTKKELASLAMIENIQRVQLSPIEEAILYKRMLDDKIFQSIREIASKLGKDHSGITKKINVLKLDKKILDDIVNNNTTKDVTGLAAINAFTKDPDQQWILYSMLKDEGRNALNNKIKELKSLHIEDIENNIEPINIKNTKKNVQIKINKKIPEMVLNEIKAFIEDKLSEVEANIS